MKSVKAPTSISYKDSLITRLTDLNYASVYLETHLEEEGDPKPELIKLALSDVLEALGPAKLSAEQMQVQYQQLEALLTAPGDQAIESLASWLKVLGLKLTVIPCEEIASETT